MIMTLTVDQLLEKIGSFGRFQWLLLGYFGYVGIVCSAFPNMIVAFILAEPDWTCTAEGRNSSVCNFTEPIGLISADYEARCGMPRNAWKYVDGYTSAVTEYDLVCEKSHLLMIAQSCFWAGMFIALMFGGYVGDRWGRKITFYFPLVGFVLATWIMVYPKHFGVFIACRTVIGMSSGVMAVAMAVLLTEYTDAVNRAKMVIHLFNFWTAGLPILSLMGFLLPNWRNFLLASVVMATPALSLWRFVPESIRWLLLNNKYGKAVEQLGEVAKINKKKMPGEEIAKPIIEEQGSLCHLFYNWEVTKRSLINWDLWMSVSLVYFGVSYGSVDLGWNPYLAFALTSLIEFPSNFAAIWAAGRYGRKKTTVFGLIFACISSIVAIVIPHKKAASTSVNTISRVMMAIFAKFFVTISFSCIYVWTAELFPTFIRNMAVSFGSAGAIVGSISAHYVIWLIRIHPMLPFGIMGFFCFKSSLVTIFLPETNGQATVETMLDMKLQESGSKGKKQDTTMIRNKAFEEN